VVRAGKRSAAADGGGDGGGSTKPASGMTIPDDKQSCGGDADARVMTGTGVTGRPAAPGLTFHPGES